MKTDVTDGCFSMLNFFTTNCLVAYFLFLGGALCIPWKLTNQDHLGKSKPQNTTLLVVTLQSLLTVVQKVNTASLLHGYTYVKYS